MKTEAPPADILKGLLSIVELRLVDLGNLFCGGGGGADVLGVTVEK